jgi:light-regulated signal transduction histidine kinase (bacteriophytochrome)
LLRRQHRLAAALREAHERIAGLEAGGQTEAPALRPGPESEPEVARPPLPRPDPAPADEPAASSEPARPRPLAAPASDAEHEALGTLVSHDLRAPIRVVEGFTRIVKEDYADVLDGVGHDHLDRVLGAAGRMNHMIDALLALSRLASQPLERVPVDLSQLATYVVDDLRRLRPEREVEVEIESGMTALGDPTLLRMVLENLLGNAWKYTGNAACPRVAFVRAEGDPATFVVRDNGAGFDMRYADRLFGVFQRLHSASEFPGTGVGLASVRRIVRRHGGEIRASGEPERGASFHFSLPADAAGV